MSFASSGCSLMSSVIGPAQKNGGCPLGVEFWQTDYNFDDLEFRLCRDSLGEMTTEANVPF